MNPEKLSELMRRLWILASVACAGAAVGYVLLEEPRRAMVCICSSAVLFIMSHWRDE